jgi:glycosyltransferase involved in cell wall biosynthesis
MIAYSSKAAADYVRAGVPASRVVVAHNAIEDKESQRYLALWGADNTWIPTWKEEMGFSSDLPVVLFVGRLIPQKKVSLLIEACEPLLDRCQLLIVGDGPSRAALETQAQPYSSCIRFVGHQTGEPLAKCFIGSDVFVLPGSGGLAVHQAMSYGKPVVVSFGDGTEADLVRDEQNGFFVQAGDPLDLRDKILKLIDQPGRRLEMGQLSLHIIRHEMGMDAMVQSFLRALSIASPSGEGEA